MILAQSLAGKNRRLEMVVVGLIAIKLLLVFAFACHARFVMDEFAQLGQSKHIGHEFFRTIWPAKAVGYAVFYLPSHWLGWNAASTMLIGRMQTALLGCAICGLVYNIAKNMGEDRLRALIVILVLLSFSNFEERIFRTRAEPLALFFATAALLVVLRGGTERSVRILAAGVLSGLSFLATQKAVYFNGALGLALVIDAVWSRRYLAAVSRGWWLVLGWVAMIAVYCFAFGGTDPLPVLKNLFLGPVEVAVRGGDVYSDLSQYVVQTLMRNGLLYALCFAGMGIALARFGKLAAAERIALVFSVVMTVLVFAHNQPWPYVFIMALPFMALWSPHICEGLPRSGRYRSLAGLMLIAGIALSFLANINFMRFDNRAQLDLIARAEAMLEPGDTYFDGIGMLPNRRESTPLWLDKRKYLITLSEGEASAAYRGLLATPPKIILWSYRLDAIRPVIGPIIRDRYVAVSPNILIAGSRLVAAKPVRFDPPVGGRYALYGMDGKSLSGSIEIDGVAVTTPVRLATGGKTLLLGGGGQAYLLPEGLAPSDIRPGPDDPGLFDGVYN